MSFAGIKSLSYMVQRLSNVSRRKIRLTTQNLTSAKGGAAVVVEFPPALLDLATFTMYAKVTVADGAQFTTVVNAEHLIESYYLESGGQILTQPFKFNDLVHILESYQMGDRLNVRRALQILSPAPASGIVAAPGADLGASTPIAIHNWVGVISSLAPSKVDFSLFPQTRLRIKLADPKEVVLSSTAVVGTYQLDDIEFEVDVLDLSPEYYNALEQRLSGGGMLELPYTQWYDFSASSGTLNGLKLQTQLASQSVDALIATYKVTTNIGVPTASGTGRASANYAYGSSGFTGVNFKLNSTNFPEYGTMDVSRSLMSAVEMLCGSQDTVSSIVPAMDSLTAYKNGHLAVCLRTNFGNEESMGSRLISGISSTGQPLNILVEYKGDAATVTPYLFVATTASILVGANKQVTVRY